MTPAGAAASGTSHAAALHDTLAALERLSKLYRDEALNFSCRESITYRKDFEATRHYTLQYIYVFRQPGGLIDYRTLWGKTLPVDLRTYDVPSYVQRGYSWMFLFEQARQVRHTWRLEDGGTVLGRPAVALSFTPIPPVVADVNDWHGTLWVDRESRQILKVVAMKDDDREEKLRFEAHLVSPDHPDRKKTVSYAWLEVTTEFSVEKNGMRFPGMITIQQNHWDVTDLPRSRSKARGPSYTVTQAYDDYRFFGIRTLEEINRITAGEAPGTR